MASLVVLAVKNLPASAGDIRDGGSGPGLGRSPEEEKGENPMVRGAWWARGHAVAESDADEMT